MKKSIIFLLVALAYSTCLKAQSVNGIVMGNDSIYIPYATVSLMHANDSSYITGVMSNENGNFSFRKHSTKLTNAKQNSTSPKSVYSSIN